jgi:3-hydroxyisobutyrate dehydrogenase
VPHVIEKSPANNGYHPGFMAKMMLKDLRLAEDAAEVADAALPLGNKASELYALFVNEGHGEMDFSAIIKMIADTI